MSSVPSGGSPATLSDQVEFLSGQPDLWGDTHLEILEKVFMKLALSYGSIVDERLIPRLGSLYEIFQERMTDERRQHLLTDITSYVDKGQGSFFSFYPCLFAERAIHIVATAAIYTAVYMPLDDGDELTGPRELLQFLTFENDEATRTGILSGLLLLGDKRVLPLIRGCWQLLGKEGRRRLALNTSGFVYASQVEFYLDWLDEANEEDFPHVAAGLAKLPRQSRVQKVLDVERKFPVFAPDSRPVITYLGEWTFEEYGKIIEPRMRELLRREEEPKVLPVVLEAWGLDPEN